MTLATLNDLHLGAVRSGGTTPATALQLRADGLQTFEEMLYDIHTDLMILGDLFDTADIHKGDLLRVYRLLDDWMTRTGKNLWLVNGNHDISRNSSNLSSFQFLAGLLTGEEGRWPGKVTHVQGEGQMTPHGYVIPHVANQDLFDFELSKVPACDFLFVHCNYDNHFAVESDHSLNLSREQAEKLPVEHIVFAHEHQRRTELNGKVLVIGNQFPSSISDCLHNSHKYMLLTDSTKNSVDATFKVTWEAEGDFSEQDWRSLEDTGRFIRVTGKATAAEAAEVISTIAKFRNKAKALVITNAVAIEGQNNSAELELTHEQITAFDVKAALLAMLTPEEGAKINKLLEKRNAARTTPE